MTDNELLLYLNALTISKVYDAAWGEDDIIFNISSINSHIIIRKYKID